MLCVRVGSRGSQAAASVDVAVYTPHPLMLEEPKPTPLKELVQRQRRLWQVALIMRPSIKVWAEQTEGVVIGPDGPELVIKGALTLSPTEPVANAEETSETSPEGTTATATAPRPSDLEAIALTMTPDSLPEAQKEAGALTPKALLATAPAPDASASPTMQAAPATDPNPGTLTREADPPLKVGDRVIWLNAPAHWSSWGALTITQLQQASVLVDCSQIWIPISELRRADE